MNYSFEYIDIILLAMIAGFIFLRLRGILGKRTGFEGESAPQFQEILKNVDTKIKTDKVWFDAFDDLNFRTINYIRSMRRNGENLKEAPRIKLSTIHSVKGGEEDNVMLLTDLTHNTNKSYRKNPDDETRLFYVGATRTKENLHIIRPKDYEKSFPMEDV